MVRNLAHWLNSRKRSGAPVTLCVLHATAGHSGASSIEHLIKVGLSYHYIIDRDGSVTKCVPLSRAALHAGNSYGPREAARGLPRTQDRNANFVARCSVNDYSVGISFANMDDGEPITYQQFHAAKYLIKDIQREYPAMQVLTTHWAVSPRRKVDPVKVDHSKLNQLATELNMRVYL